MSNEKSTSKKRTVLVNVAVIVAALALIGGGTFAAWSDFDTVSDQQVGAGNLTIVVTEPEEHAWDEALLSPGDDPLVEYLTVGNDTDSTVPSVLHVTLNMYKAFEDGCTNTYSEELADPDCVDGNAADVEGGQFPYFTDFELTAVPIPAGQSCGPALFTGSNGYTLGGGSLASFVALTGGGVNVGLPGFDPNSGAWDNLVVFPDLVLENGDDVCVAASLEMPDTGNDEIATPAGDFHQNAVMGDYAKFGFLFLLEQDLS